MSRRQVSFLLAGVLVLSGLSGCRCTNGERVRYVPPPRGMEGTCDRCATNGPMPPRFVPNTTPVIPGPASPAVPAPGLPPGAVTVPPGAVPPPPANTAYPPPNPQIQQNSYNPPAAPSAPSAARPGVYLEQPEPTAPEPARPMPTDAPPARETRPYTPQSPEPPPVRDDRNATPAMPVDIPHFAMVKPSIASGLEPFADGVSWLKTHGYRTVLFIRPPGTDDSAARRRFEQSGLRYLSLELSPQTLSRESLDGFQRIVADANNLPLFVYDADASLAGALWYLHFRVIDGASEEKARASAEQLGFKKDRSENHLKMWLAVQNLMKDLKP